MTTDKKDVGEADGGNEGEDRRLFLQKLGGFAGGALGFLSFPGPARAADVSWEPPTGPSLQAAAAELQEFDRCDRFAQFSDGKDCTTGFTCGSSGFNCRGSALDDFECTVFACTAFVCNYSFDDEDCEEPGQFHCKQHSEFACQEGYN